MFRASFASLMAVLVLAARCLGGSGEGIEIIVEQGEIEFSFAVLTPGQPPQTFVKTMDVTSAGLTEQLHFDLNGLVIDADLGFFLDQGSSIARIELSSNLSISRGAYVGTARVRTSEAIVFRMLDTADVFDAFDSGSMELIPISGEIQGGLVCPGSFALVFDDVVEVSDSVGFDLESSSFLWDLETPIDAVVRFVEGAGSNTGDEVKVTGSIFDANGDDFPANSPGQVESDYAYAEGCTSGGLGDGYGFAQLDAAISNNSNGEFAVSVYANANASQNSGHNGTVFIGAFAEPLRLRLDKEKAFTLSRNGSFSITDENFQPIQGARMGPGIYLINGSASVFLDPFETSGSDSGSLTLLLRDPPCNAADFAAPSGILDFGDVLEFIDLFGSQDPRADIAAPIGSLDFNDILAFLSAYGLGCP